MFLHSYKHKGSRSGSSALASLPDSCVFTNKSPNCDWELSGSSSKEQIYKEHLQNAWGFGPQNDTTGDRIMSGQRQTLLGSISWGEWYCAILCWNRNKMQINTFMGALFEFTSVAIAEQWKKKMPRVLELVWSLTCCSFCCSVTQWCLTLCDPMNCSTPGLPVPHHLPEFAQIHVHSISDSVQPSHPLMPSSPFALNHWSLTSLI